MGKDKLRKFRENLTFDCFIQPEFDEVFRCDHPLKGHWRSDFFHNGNPIVLELGCGKGEYTVALAERDPSRNFIGIDIKGARMWLGAKTATDRKMPNVGFRARASSLSTACSPRARSTRYGSPSPTRNSRAAGRRNASPRRFSSDITPAYCPGGGSTSRPIRSIFSAIRTRWCAATGCHAKSRTPTSTARLRRRGAVG